MNAARCGQIFLKLIKKIKDYYVIASRFEKKGIIIQNSREEEEYRT